ncbi:MAG TPA: DUF4214 domain-containing protein [Pyrinomonadaceae bacterium]|jgi:hypothetical protein|nr:DUF4214 domain-containing protein [Pyrinomonadaceae bacterium]
MKVIRLFSHQLLASIFGVLVFVTTASAQTIDPNLQPDSQRVLAAKPESIGGKGRANGYTPAQARRETRPIENRRQDGKAGSTPTISRPSPALNVPAVNSIQAGTPLTQILHTAQVSLTSSAGTDEQFVDRNGDLIADERTTFDLAGGSFDIAVGRSGVRYEVYSATLNNSLVGVLVVAADTNGDYHIDSSTTYNLRTDFALRSAAAIVSGVSKAGREFVIISSSGYYNSSDPNDPNNEPSPGVILLVRDPATGGFDNSRTRTLVTVGDNRLYNANALALLPNNDLLIADFHSDELRIIRDTDNDGMPDTLATTPYYSYRFSNDQPLDVAVNSRGVVFSYSAGNDTVMLVLYDDDGDGAADRDEVCIEGLSIDNNLFLHGLTVDGPGSIYVIEDASGAFDGTGGNGGPPRIDAFPDRFQDGFPTDGAIFTRADDPLSQGLSGVAFGPLPPNRIDDPQFFVTQHYRDFLNREPDAPGLAFWVNEITSCGTNAQCIQVKRVNVSAAFFLSIEFQETGYLVYRFYKAGYGNFPSEPVPLRFNEFLPDTQQIGLGVVVGAAGWQTKLEDNKKAYAAAFGARASLAAVLPTSLTPTQFVDGLYTNAGVASPPSSERTAAINEFSGAGNTTDTAARGRALRRVAEDSTLGQQELNRAFVLMQYYGYLRRNPYDPPEATLDYQGYNFWLGKLNQFNGDYVGAEMVKAFLVSGEYRQRFVQ